jgi:hypothetical protein
METVGWLLDKDKFLYGGLDSKVSVINLLTIDYFHLTFTLTRSRNTTI